MGRPAQQFHHRRRLTGAVWQRDSSSDPSRDREFATLDRGDLHMVKTSSAPSRGRRHGRGARSPGRGFLALGLAWAVAVGALGAFVRPTAASAEGTPAYKNTSLPFSVRAADLVSRMTLEEKYDQLIAMQPHATWR